MEPLPSPDLLVRLAFHTELFADLIWFLVFGGIAGLALSLFRRHK